MPKGVYDRTHLYRQTEKFLNGLMILRAHDANFKPTELTTNEEVYGMLSHFGFAWRDGMWRYTIHRNGHNPDSVQSKLPEPEITLQPIANNRLEMTLSNDQLDTVQGVIEAMHTLGFVVEVRIIGTRG